MDSLTSNNTDRNYVISSEVKVFTRAPLQGQVYIEYAYNGPEEGFYNDEDGPLKSQNVQEVVQIAAELGFDDVDSSDFSELGFSVGKIRFSATSGNKFPLDTSRRFQAALVEKGFTMKSVDN